MQVRFFCPTHGGALSELAIRYVDALVADGARVRVLSTKVFQTSSKAWMERSRLFLTEVTDLSVNVVMGDPSDWQRLWTKGLKNVLIVNTPPPPADLHVSAMEVTGSRIDESGKKVAETHRTEAGFALAAAAKYDLVIVDQFALVGRWFDAIAEVIEKPYAVQHIHIDPPDPNRSLFRALS